jgi:hypothetical protein
VPNRLPAGRLHQTSGRCCCRRAHGTVFLKSLGLLRGQIQIGNGGHDAQRALVMTRGVMPVGGRGAVPLGQLSEHLLNGARGIYEIA